MHILFLVPYPMGESPSQRFRFEQYFRLLKENKIGFSVSSFWGLRAWQILYQRGRALEKGGWLLLGLIKRTIDLVRAMGCDLVFIHRECAPVGPPIFEFVLAKILRKKIVYDFDDAIWLPNTSEENSLAGWLKFHGKVEYICRWSARVSCGNDWLATYARQFNAQVVVNPTTIDTENLHNSTLWNAVKHKDRIVIGWTGTHSTIGYLNELLPVLQSIEKKFPIIFRVISNKNPHMELESFEFIPWSKPTEIPDLLTFDIGIMPLAKNDWANGKCGFKALQYMALGIACVASDVGVNTFIIHHSENGFLCNTEEAWAACLEKLILDSALRKKIGLTGRQTVVEHYSVSSNGTNFLSLTRL